MRLSCAASACTGTLHVVREVVVTDHAINRYRERVRPGLPFRRAEAELLRVLALGVWSDVAPLWLPYAPSHDSVVGFVLVGDDIALPVAGQGSGDLAVTTCLVRGGHAEEVRVARRAVKKARQGERRRRREERRVFSGGAPSRRGLAA